MLRLNVVAAKARLAKSQDDFKARHNAGCPGIELCALISNLRDAVIGELLDDALKDLGEDGPKGLLNDVAIVAHGGYGRRDVAPYSDVDLMILHRPSAAGRLFPLAERLVRDVFDVGLDLGHSVRTVPQACRMASRDATICTSLIADRLATSRRQHGHLRQLHAPFPPARCVAKAAAAPRHPQCPARRTAALWRDGFPLGAEHQAIARHAPRPGDAPLDRLRPLWRR
jgi:UTP:GlnB (protein PII) uridylyltransferase